MANQPIPIPLPTIRSAEDLQRVFRLPEGFLTTAAISTTAPIPAALPSTAAVAGSAPPRARWRGVWREIQRRIR